MNIDKSSSKTQSGLSLIELMVALAVSAILLLGVTTVYTASKRSYQVTDEFSEIQENARFALNVLAKNIRMSGFTGCASMEGLEGNVTNNTGDTNYDFSKASVINGHAGSGSWTNKPAGILSTTDALVIQKASSCSASVTEQMDNAKKLIKYSGDCPFAKNEILLVTDCRSADIFKNVNDPGGAKDETDPNQAGPNSITSSTALSKKYGDDAFVYKFEHLIYYIKNNSDSKPTLHQLLIGGNDSEIIANIEDIAFKYGEDTDGDNSIDVIRSSAATVADWSRVINVYVHLLLRSEPVGTDKKPYSFNGTDVAAADSDTRFRKEFVTAINLRNRTP